MAGTPEVLRIDAKIEGTNWRVHVAYETAADAQQLQDMTADQFDDWMQANQSMLVEIAEKKIKRLGLPCCDVTITSDDLP